MQSRDANNFQTQWSYDDYSDQVTSEQHRSWTGRFFGILGRRLWSYDSFGRLRSTTDVDQHVTTYGYDVLNRLNRVERADGGADSYLFNHWGTANGVLASVQSVVKVTAPTSAGFPTGDGRSFPGVWHMQYFDGFGTVFETLTKADNGDAARVTRSETSTAAEHKVVFSRPVFDSEPADVDLLSLSYDSANRPSTVYKLSPKRLDGCRCVRNLPLSNAKKPASRSRRMRHRALGDQARLRRRSGQR